MDMQNGEKRQKAYHMSKMDEFMWEFTVPYWYYAEIRHVIHIYHTKISCGHLTLYLNIICSRLIIMFIQHVCWPLIKHDTCIVM